MVDWLRAATHAEPLAEAGVDTMNTRCCVALPLQLPLHVLHDPHAPTQSTGQSLELHVLITVWLCVKLQPTPLPSTSTDMVNARCCVPPPQLASHALQLDHDPTQSAHTSVLHSSSWLWVCKQSLPPCAAVCNICSVRLRLPVLHSSEQSVHDVHSPMQSTGQEASELHACISVSSSSAAHAEPLA